MKHTSKSRGNGSSCIGRSTKFGQVIDVLVAQKQDLAATRRFFTQALEHGPRPTEVSTDRAPASPRVLDELVPAVVMTFIAFVGLRPGMPLCAADR